jgi:hypothetical protein
LLVARAIFLEPAVADPAEAGADAVGGEVGLLGLVDGNENGFAVVDDVEFVLVEGREGAL